MTPIYKQSEIMTFTAIPPDEGIVAKLSGDTWRIYAAGHIDTRAGDRLEAFFKAKQIPAGSYLFLNSPVAV